MKLSSNSFVIKWRFFCYLRHPQTLPQAPIRQCLIDISAVRHDTKEKRGDVTPVTDMSSIHYSLIVQVCDKRVHGIKTLQCIFACVYLILSTDWSWSWENWHCFFYNLWPSWPTFFSPLIKEIVLATCNLKGYISLTLRGVPYSTEGMGQEIAKHYTNAFVNILIGWNYFLTTPGCFFIFPI